MVPDRLLRLALVAASFPCLCHGQSFLIAPEPLSNTGITNVTGPLSVGYVFMSDSSSLLVEAVGYFVPPETTMGPSSIVTIWDEESGAKIHEENVGGTGVAMLNQTVTLSAGTRYIISMTLAENVTTNQYTFDTEDPDILVYNAPIATILVPAQGPPGTAPTPLNGTAYIGMPNFWVGNFTEQGLAAVTATADVVGNSETPIPTGVELPPASPAATSTSAPEATSGTVTNPPPPPPEPPAPTSSNDEKITKAGAAAVAITTIICIGIVVGGILLHKYGSRWRQRRQEEHKHVFASNLSGVSSMGTTSPSGHRRFYDIEDPDVANDTEMGLYAPSSTTSTTGHTAAV